MMWVLSLFLPWLRSRTRVTAHLPVETCDVGLQIGDVLQLAQPRPLGRLAIGDDPPAELLAAACVRATWWPERQAPPFTTCSCEGTCCPAVPDPTEPHVALLAMSDELKREQVVFSHPDRRR